MRNCDRKNCMEIYEISYFVESQKYTVKTHNKVQFRLLYDVTTVLTGYIYVSHHGSESFRDILIVVTCRGGASFLASSAVEF